MAHPSFVRPDNDTKIWRYMDFTKFVSLLETKSLFFSTFAVLREEDKHEGTYNPATIEAHRAKKDENVLSIFDIGSGLLQAFGKMLAINCWHMNEIESVAMWKIYLKSNEGIAIQSTVKRLETSFANNQDRPLVGKVHYLDENQVIPEPDGFNGFNAALWKWRSYEYENELRAVIMSRPEVLYQHNGLYVAVAPTQLIENIVVSPKSPKWFLELVQAMAHKYDLGEKVVPSRLSISPGAIESNQFTVQITCPRCDAVQDVVTEPFLVKDYPNDTSIVFSADRVSIHCHNCGGLLAFPVRPQMEYVDEPPETPDQDR